MSPLPFHPSQSTPPSFAAELRHLLQLALPIAGVQLGMTALQVVDVAMLGRHDEAALPAMALGSLLAFGAMMFCLGTLAAIDPLLSQAVGAGDHGAIPRVLGRGLLLAALLTVPAAAVLWPAAHWLELAGQPPELIPAAASYARLQMLSVPPFLAYGVVRSLLSARARLRPQLLTIAAGNLANALLDWVLIFGHLGFPALGATGAALATVACRWLMLLGLCWFGWRELGPPLRALAADRDLRRRVVAPGPLWRLFRLGAPIGGQFALEMGVFAATGLLIGNMDARAAAGGTWLGGHQVALQLASLSFMVPLGLGIAASVRVGWAVGRADRPAVRRSVAAALGTGAVLMTGFMALFLACPGMLAALLVDHTEVAAVAAALIPIAGVFQIGDGLQVVAIGCLRGLGDTRSPLLANTVGFWLIGLPFGLWLGSARGGGPAGLWWGLVCGLFLVALWLLFALRWRIADQRGRLAVD